MHLDPVRPSTPRRRLGAPVAAGFALLVAVGGTVALVTTVGEAPGAAAEQADRTTRSETRAAGEHGSGPGSLPAATATAPAASGGPVAPATTADGSGTAGGSAGGSAGGADDAAARAAADGTGRGAADAAAAAAAAARAAAEAAAREESERLAAQEAALDPRFTGCAEANAQGYGHYVSGVDPEYGWYSDVDADGVVCEA